VRNAYVDAIKNSFIALDCTVGKFSARDAQLAQELQERGITLEIVQDALLMGATRKYISWLNGGLPQPILSLAYFEALVLEVQERPFRRVTENIYEERSPSLQESGRKNPRKRPEMGVSDMPCPKIVQ
jgi:hypothetical protein